MRRHPSSKREEIATGAGTKYACYFERSPGGGYTVACPALPAVAACGDTLTEARANAREAIEEWNDEIGRLHARFWAVCYTQDL